MGNVMNKIEVSVIVPVYNVEHYIAKTIESLQFQKFENFEIILVDDGSQDDSGKICDQFAATDERIKVIHKQNGGVMSARYAGVDSAIGRYIVFLDGDDRMPPEALKKMYNAISQNDVDYVMGACVDIDSSGNRINDNVYDAGFSGLIEDNSTYRTHVTRHPRGMNMKMYKKDLLTAKPIVKIPSTIRNNEDLIFNVLLSAKINRVMAIKDIVYLIVMRPGSASRRSYDVSYWYNLFEWMDSAYAKYDVYEKDYMQYKLKTIFYKIVRENKECDYSQVCFDNLKRLKYKKDYGIKGNVVLFVVKNPCKMLRTVLAFHPKRFLKKFVSKGEM